MVTQLDAVLLAAREIEQLQPCLLEAQLNGLGVPEIGFGTTRYDGGLPVSLGDVTSLPVARGMLRHELIKDTCPVAERLPYWPRLGVKRQAALLSFLHGGQIKQMASRGDKELRGALIKRRYDDVPALLMGYDRDYLGRVCPRRADRRKREAALWCSEADDMTTLVAKQETWLKRAPIDQAYLSDEGKKRIAAGEEIEVSSVEEIARDAHDWLTTAGGERWAVYMPHWQPRVVAKTAPQPGIVDWSDFNAPVSAFLTVGEVLRYDGRRRPTRGSTQEENILQIAKEFDAIREAWGGPIAVTSGYRPEPINSQVGGVSGSRHVSGQALDICPVDGKLKDFYNWIKRRWSGGLGDGCAKGFVHIDTRDGGKFKARGDASPAANWLY